MSQNTNTPPNYGQDNPNYGQENQYNSSGSDAYGSQSQQYQAGQPSPYGQPGQYQQTSQYQQGPNPVDTGSIGWAVLGFFIPIVGLVLWLVWKDQRPNDSRMSRNGFLASLIVGVVLMIIWFIIVAIVAASGSMSMS